MAVKARELDSNDFKEVTGVYLGDGRSVISIYAKLNGSNDYIEIFSIGEAEYMELTYYDFPITVDSPYKQDVDCIIEAYTPNNGSGLVPNKCEVTNGAATTKIADMEMYGLPFYGDIISTKPLINRLPGVFYNPWGNSGFQLHAREHICWIGYDDELSSGEHSIMVGTWDADSNAAFPTGMYRWYVEVFGLAKFSGVEVHCIHGHNQRGTHDSGALLTGSTTEQRCGTFVSSVGTHDVIVEGTRMWTAEPFLLDNDSSDANDHIAWCMLRIKNNVSNTSKITQGRNFGFRMALIPDGSPMIWSPKMPHRSLTPDTVPFYGVRRNDLFHYNVTQYTQDGDRDETNYSHTFYIRDAEYDRYNNHRQTPTFVCNTSYPVVYNSLFNSSDDEEGQYYSWTKSNDMIIVQTPIDVCDSLDDFKAAMNAAGGIDILASRLVPEGLTFNDVQKITLQKGINTLNAANTASITLMGMFNKIYLYF